MIALRNDSRELCGEPGGPAWECPHCVLGLVIPELIRSGLTWMSLHHELTVTPRTCTGSSRCHRQWHIGAVEPRTGLDWQTMLGVRGCWQEAGNKHPHGSSHPRDSSCTHTPAWAGSGAASGQQEWGQGPTLEVLCVLLTSTAPASVPADIGRDENPGPGMSMLSKSEGPSVHPCFGRRPHAEGEEQGRA